MPVYLAFGRERERQEYPAIVHCHRQLYSEFEDRLSDVGLALVKKRNGGEEARKGRRKEEGRKRQEAVKRKQIRMS